MASNPLVLAARFGDDVNETTHGTICTASEVESEGVTCGLGIEGSEGGDFKEPGHVAVDETSGNVFIADESNNRVQEFTPNGVFVLTFGLEVNETKDDTAGAAGAERDICTAASGNTCTSGAAGSGLGEFDRPTGVAVDNSSGPLAGSVYVTDFNNNRVQVFSTAGAYIGQFAGTNAPKAFQGPRAIAVSSATGDVYVADQGNEVVDSFEPKSSAGSPEWSYLAQIASSHIEQPTSVAVDSAGTVYVDNRRTTVFAFSASGAYEGELAVGSNARDVAVNSAGQIFVLAQQGSAGAKILQEYAESGAVVAESGAAAIQAPEGEEFWLAVNSATEAVYVVEGYGGNAVDIFAPQNTEPSPGVVSGAATGVTEVAATLNGEVEPRGTSVMDYFEYGTSPCGPAACGGATDATGPLTGDTVQHVSATLGGLTPGTTYHYWLIARNGQGAVHGEPREFTSAVPAPRVTTTQATSVTQGSATLGGNVDPRGSATTYRFTYASASDCMGGPGQYGGLQCTVTTVPGSTASAEAGSAGSAVSIPLTGLAPHTTYYYDITATSSGGTVQGVPATFTTLPLPPEAQTLGTGDPDGTMRAIYGAVDPNGSETKYTFQYGLTTMYGNEAPTPDGDAGSGSTVEDVQAEAVDLTPGTTYHYRIVATNIAAGIPQTAYGADETFAATTSEPYAAMPGASTGAVTGMSQTQATLTGTVTPGGFPTSYFFDYGKTLYYGNEAPLGGRTAGVGSEVVVSEAVAGLEPGTTYHYRLVVSSPGGTAYGEDETFTTPPAPVVSHLSTASAGSSSPPPKKARPVTRAQKLAKALATCHKLKGSTREACEAGARKRYGAKPKPKAKKPTKTTTTTKGSR
ncbi:MAG: NHL repeat-containing protein [Solirubrobacteraceae bacterium]